MIYLDSSALVKLVREERDSAALEAWVSVRTSEALVSSDLAEVEVIRACRRLDLAARPTVRALSARIDLLPLNSALLEEAAGLEGPTAGSTAL